ncbi:MAG: HAD hydrolase family protein [Elusimicrobiaceae bacterium]|nr:HAD hydrolase family protein [Elusimicrobiaceae bacterium]
MEHFSPSFLEKAKSIKLLLTDVDGVMTDGTLSFFTDESGTAREIKHFESLDGMGLMFLSHCGISTGIVSRGQSNTLEFWAKVLGMRFLFYNTPAKHLVLPYLEQNFHITPQEIAFIGDDVIDLGLLSRVGLPLTVANSVPEVKEVSLYISPRQGGQAAVRDIAEQILKARGLWEQILQENKAGTFKQPVRELHIVKGL